MRGIQALATALFTVGAMDFAAAAEPEHWIIHDTDAVETPGPGATVAYSDCEDSDYWHECVSIEFGCTGSGDFLSINQDGREAAARLTEGNYGENSKITLHVGTAAFEVPLWDIRLEANDLDGIWSLRLEGSGFQPAFAAIAANPAALVSASVAGTKYDLTARTEDRPLLERMAKICAAGAMTDNTPLDIGMGN